MNVFISGAVTGIRAGCSGDRQRERVKFSTVMKTGLLLLLRRGEFSYSVPISALDSSHFYWLDFVLFIFTSAEIQFLPDKIMGIPALDPLKLADRHTQEKAIKLFSLSFSFFTSI